MTNNKTEKPEQSKEPEELPFVAPCRKLDSGAPLRWLHLGWDDMKQAPRQSLTYGLVILVLSLLISFTAWYIGSVYLFIAMLSGFIFIGPVLAIGLYSISNQLQQGRLPKLGYCLRQERQHLGNELVLAIILLIVLLVWARSASMVHVFFPMQGDAPFMDFAVFFGVGTAVGSIFATIVFCATAFSLPMIMDRDVDTVTAVLTSVNAVLRNKRVMLLWVMLIILALLISFLTALLGLAVLMPLIGHATWHAYLETIDANAWPRHSQKDN